MRGAEVVRIGDALFTQLAQLFAALGDDLVFVPLGRGVRLDRFGHDESVFGVACMRVGRMGLPAARRWDCVRQALERCGAANHAAPAR
jgi:hypothetical protein